MNKDDIKKIIYSIIAIFIAIILVKLFIWLLPVIAIILLAYYIYNRISEYNNNNSSSTRIINDKK